MRIMKIILLIAVYAASEFVQAQDLNADDSLRTFVQRKYDISMRGTHALLTWSALNIGTGIAGSVTCDGSEHYFHQMNTFWGGINLIISAAGYASLRRMKNQPLFLGRVELDQRKAERVFKINMGLDALYIAGGMALIESARNADLNQDRLQGYGYSIVMQGAFLLTFDGVMYLLHRKNRRQKLNPLLYKISYTGNGFIYRFG